MKKVLLATTVALMATSAAAIDLGYGVTAGGEIDVNYVTGVEDWAMDFTPSVGVDVYGVDFTAETTIDILDLDSGNDVFTGVDLKAEYALNSMITTYGKISSDEDLEFGDITVGATFSF
jgi:hypothetical protein